MTEAFNINAVREAFKQGATPSEVDYGRLIELAWVGARALGAKDSNVLSPNPGNGLEIVDNKLCVKAGNGLAIKDRALVLSLDNKSLVLDNNNALAINIDPKGGLDKEGGLHVLAGPGLITNAQGLGINLATNKSGLNTDDNGLSVAIGDSSGLEFDKKSGALQVKLDTAKNYITHGADGLCLNDDGIAAMKKAMGDLTSAALTKMQTATENGSKAYVEKEFTSLEKSIGDALIGAYNTAAVKIAKALQEETKGPETELDAEAFKSGKTQENAQTAILNHLTNVMKWIRGSDNPTYPVTANTSGKTGQLLCGELNNANRAGNLTGQKAATNAATDALGSVAKEINDKKFETADVVTKYALSNPDNKSFADIIAKTIDDATQKSTEADPTLKLEAGIKEGIVKGIGALALAAYNNAATKIADALYEETKLGTKETTYDISAFKAGKSTGDAKEAMKGRGEALLSWLMEGGWGQVTWTDNTGGIGKAVGKSLGEAYAAGNSAGAKSGYDSGVTAGGDKREQDIKEMLQRAFSFNERLDYRVACYIFNGESADPLIRGVCLSAPTAISTNETFDSRNGFVASPHYAETERVDATTELVKSFTAVIARFG